MSLIYYENNIEETQELWRTQAEIGRVFEKNSSCRIDNDLFFKKDLIMVTSCNGILKVIIFDMRPWCQTLLKASS